MNLDNRARILCVDDEPGVIEALSLQLRRDFDVVSAASGADGLQMLGELSFAVVMCDLQMPEMDGVAFLGRVRSEHPDVVRIVLTGHGDLQVAMAAINEGQIFRFLTKPCRPTELLAAAQAAVEQHRLITAEKVLLQQTLHGSIKTLTDVLALTNPVAFGRATRLKALVTGLAEHLNVTERWQVEMAALLSQLGAITLPPEVAGKLHRGEALDPDEQQMADRTPDVTEKLLANIPRLEPVRAILARYAKFGRPMSLAGADASPLIDIGVRLLHAALHFDTLESRGMRATDAVATLRGRGNAHDPAILDALVAVRGGGDIIVKELRLAGLAVGMVFAEDVELSGGALLCARGCEVTTGFLERVRNLRPGSVVEPLRVIVRK